jgi:hypothetical protein
MIRLLCGIWMRGRYGSKPLRFNRSVTCCSRCGSVWTTYHAETIIGRALDQVIIWSGRAIPITHLISTAKIGIGASRWVALLVGRDFHFVKNLFSSLWNFQPDCTIFTRRPRVAHFRPPTKRNSPARVTTHTPAPPKEASYGPHHFTALSTALRPRARLRSVGLIYRARDRSVVLASIPCFVRALTTLSANEYAGDNSPPRDGDRGCLVVA